jgi:hypothetical protein
VFNNLNTLCGNSIIVFYVLIKINRTNLKDLVEDGFDDWVIPTFEGLVFVSSGGASLPGNISSNHLWTAHIGGIAMNAYTCLSLSNGNIALNEGQTINTYVRCVRHESISVSGSGSSSGGSNTASTLGSGMPTMISLEQPNMEAKAGIIYCDSLSESGYDDWVMPTIDQLSYALSGGCVIPDTRTSNKISTRTPDPSGVWYMTADGSDGGMGIEFWFSNESGTFNKCIRCVR